LLIMPFRRWTALASDCPRSAAPVNLARFAGMLGQGWRGKAGRVPIHRDPPRRARSARPATQDGRITVVATFRLAGRSTQGYNEAWKSFQLSSLSLRTLS